MTDRYMEDALLAVKAYLKSKLDDMLSTIASERSDDVPAIGYLTIGESRVAKYPRIEVLPDNTRPDYGFDDVPLTEPWFFHSIAVMVSHTAGKVAVVQNTLLRYVEGIHRITYADSTFGDAFVWVRLSGEDYTPMVENQETKKMIQAVVIQLECKTR
ncbi:MAG: hypothetical protein ACTSUO_05420 [Candidatus Thorarchaeota archaeon]